MVRLEVVAAARSSNSLFLCPPPLVSPSLLVNSSRVPQTRTVLRSPLPSSWVSSSTLRPRFT
ncbi:hypothetical protein FOXYSP1_09452 [Fusarium oxysporum f. sp. phaseoli]